LTKDKTQKVILVSIVPLPKGKKMTVFRDLTHERRQEKIIEAQQETMIESARLSSLGEMAAGIAHEINNPLAIIQGSADLVHAALEKGGMEPEKLARSMERISSTVSRIAKIITGLKSFARDGSKDPFVPASLKAVVGEALELCQSRYRHNGVELILNLPEEDVLVAARPVQLAQLLVNLLNNAFDAVENQAQKKVCIGVEIAGGDACLRVLDNGPGVPPELRDKILQPFFTTKAPGKGTGLGLSLSRAIVESHGGRLEIKTIGGLTCFEAALPLLPAA
ncbi:MAG: GHKL domain-containing protein, partial [Proteobacteria bacterium]